MREMASSDSIRTAKADDERPKLKRKRFEDPTLFDVFQSRAVIAGPPSAARRHDRLPSNSSVASSNSDTSRTAPHRITVSTSATEDPRFAIWGLKDGPTRPAAAGGDRYGSIAQEMEVGSPVSTTMSDRGSPATMGSTRWSLRRSVASNGDNSSPASSVRGSVGSNGGYTNRQQRVLMAATVERWVVELTSKIEADLLSGFFLTYRSFVRPLDLLRLLITRFQWAMAATATAEDGAARRIVRVRTFVVIRHWLLNHFTDDFLPDRQLRTTLTEWLNASSREPRILESAKDERLIKGLKKLVRRLKEMHVALGPGDTAEAARELSGGYVDVGVSSSTTAHGSRTRGSDDDVDLEVVAPSLSFDPSSPPPHIRSPSAAQVFHVKVDPIQFSTSRSSHIFNSDPNPTLPGPDNVIARSFTSALGTIGRFKRILSNRSPTPAPSFGACVNAEAFDEDLFRTSDTGDLLWVKGGLDRFLQFYNIQHDAGAETTPLDLEELGIIGAQSLETLVQSDDQVDPVDVSGDGLGISGVEHAEETMMKKAAPTYLSHAQSGRSLRTDLTRLGVTPSFTPETSAYDLLDQPLDNLFLQRPGSTHIELDDVDLSDEDDDVVEVKRTLKRLPGASDLRTAAFARHLAGPPRGNRYSNSSVSSYGSRIDRTSMVSEGSHENLPEGIQVVPNFILEGIDTSDDEEPGDVEAALRRLEGIVDDSKEKEKARRVERQMAKSNQLEQLKQLGASLSRPMDVLPPPRPPSVVSIDSAPVVLPLEEEADAETRSPTEEREELDTVPSSRLQLPPQPSSLSRRGGLRTMPSISKLFAAASKPPPRPPVVAPPVHRSFLLVARTEVLAQQFCLIERDMLRCMGWQELVGGDWSDPARRLDVLDWERYLKERRKLELAARATGVRAPSDVQAVIARFNLTANWVCSEVRPLVSLLYDAH
jgi:GDP/GTP exchange factor required for growth at low temperature